MAAQARLDPLAVSVVVIKSLSCLCCPLLSVGVPSLDGRTVAARDELLEAVFVEASKDVREAILRHVLGQLPEAQGRAFQVGSRWQEGEQ